MPELPEVETVRRHLAPRLEGRRIERLEVRDARWTLPVDPRAVEEAVAGRRVEELARRGKHLITRLEDDLYLLMHLRMTGTLLADPAEEPAHTRVRFALDDGGAVLFVDPRRFGTGMLVAGPAELERFLAARLGLEPFDEGFTATHLAALARNRSAPAKAFLLDQTKIAGIGNIYADEALFRAGVHPAKPAGRITRRGWEELRAAIVAALQAGIDAKGASIDDFRDPYGAQGSFQDQFLVHRREGLPCPRCGTAVRKAVVAGRGTYWCPRCQRAPRRR